MEQEQTLRPRVPRHKNRVGPRAVTPAAVCFLFRRRVLRIADQNIGALCILAENLVVRDPVLVVGRIDDHGAVAFNSISRSALRMIQRKRHEWSGYRT